MTPDGVIDSRRDHLRRSKEHIATISEAVKANARETEKQIYDILQAALQKHAELTSRKLHVLQSVEVDLLREMFSLEWMECYLRDQRDNLPPAAFLKAWARHMDMRATQYNFTYQPPETLVNVKPDIGVKGSINVTAGNDVETHNRRDNGRFDEMDPSAAVASPQTRRFVSLLLDEKTGEELPRVSSTHQPQLKAQEKMLSLNGADPQALLDFQQKADNARRGVHRSLQRAASNPDEFDGVVDANRNAIDAKFPVGVSTSGRRLSIEAAPRASGMFIPPGSELSRIASEKIEETPTLLDRLLSESLHFEGSQILDHRAAAELLVCCPFEHDIAKLRTIEVFNSDRHGKSIR